MVKPFPWIGLLLSTPRKTAKRAKFEKFDFTTYTGTRIRTKSEMLVNTLQILPVLDGSASRNVANRWRMHPDPVVLYVGAPHSDPRRITNSKLLSDSLGLEESRALW